MHEHSHEKSITVWPASRLLPGCLLAAALAAPAFAQNFPITPAQRGTAQQVAEAGVPLADLAPNAPEEYTVKRGDTLWAISGLYLAKPWRWPELWGMNMEQVRNPHLIYPGQQLVLEKRNGRATLRVRQAAAAGEDRPTDTVRLSPRIRVEPLASNAIPTVRMDLIEAFLSEPLIVDDAALARAPRIVAAPETRVMITRGDRAYARGLPEAPLKVVKGATDFRVVRSAKPLRDPVTGAVLGYEAAYLGKASLVRGEGVEAVRTSSGSLEQMPVPATIDIVSAKEEMIAGDRLLPEPPRQFTNYVPHAPAADLQGTIISVYGDAVAVAGQNQVVVINRGTADGIEAGHVLAILKAGEQRLDVDPSSGRRTTIKLPDERNGLVMVFRPFDHLSYALILEITDAVKVGDHVASPQ